MSLNLVQMPPGSVGIVPVCRPELPSYFILLLTALSKKQPVSCSSWHLEISSHLDMLIEALFFSFCCSVASKKDIHHSWTFGFIMLEVIRACLTLLGITGLNLCQEMCHTLAQYCQDPSVRQYTCFFCCYSDYNLCINMEYSFTAFVSRFVLFNGGWDVSRLLPGERFPVFAKVCPPPCLSCGARLYTCL